MFMVDIRELVLSEITPLPRMSRSGGPISHHEWHAESPDRVFCGAECDWHAERSRMMNALRGTRKHNEAVEARLLRSNFEGGAR